MVVRAQLFSVLLAVLMTSACRSKPAPAPGGRAANVLAPEPAPIATVNGKELPPARFNLLFEARRAAVHGPLGEAVAWRIKNNLVRELVDERLIEDAAERRKVTVDDKKVEAAIAARRQSFSSARAFEEFLAGYPEGLAGLRHTERLRLTEEALAGVDDARPLDEKEVRAWYDQHRALYHVPAHFLAQEIFWPLAAKDPAQKDATQKDATLAKAKEVLGYARAGKVAFSVLARRYSQGPTAAAGGDLGKVSEGAVEAPIYKALQALKAGEISDVVSTDTGLRVVKLLAKRPAVDIAFDKARPGVERSLRLAARSTRVSQLLIALRHEAQVENLLLTRYPLLAQADTAVSTGRAPGLGAPIAGDAKPSATGVGKTAGRAGSQ